MFKSLVHAASLALLTAAAMGQCATLSYFGAFNGQKGTMFEIQNLSATQPMVIGSFDQAFYTTGSADMEIYTIAGPCAGLELNAAAWSLVGTAAGVAHTGTTTNPAPTTPIPIPINIVIAPGATQSFYITATNATGSSVYYTSGSGQYGVQYASNADIALIGRTGMSYPFGSAFGIGTAGRLWNGIVNYCPGGSGTVLSTNSTIGSGCVNQFASIYENQTAFDLANTSLSFQFIGTGYAVLPGVTPIAPQTSAPVTMGDDVVIPFALGWTFPYAGGATTDIYVSSNGFLHLGVNTASGCCAFAPATFFNGGSPCFSAKWRDLNPSSLGTVQFDTDPVNGVAYVTFTGVPDFGSTTNLNDFQYVLNQNGSVEIRYGNVAPTAGAVGFSPGQNNLAPAQTDFSTLGVAVTGTTDIVPLTLAASPRPIANTSVSFTTSNLPATTAFGAVLVGINNPALDLSALGMPGCTQYSDGMLTILYVTGGAASVVTPFNVPNLVGFHLFAQSVAYAPAAGLTPLGAIASNGIDMGIGDY
jgi:hypothetical protein